MKIQVMRLHHKELPLPAYMTKQAAGLDLLAAIDEPVELAPGKRALIPTGLAFALPEGVEAQVRPRSGLALKYGITLLNTPGTIDADYRGEIKVLVINFGQETYVIHQGERIAQVVFARVEKAEWVEVQVLDPTKRAHGGFGHTGTI